MILYNRADFNHWSPVKKNRKNLRYLVDSINVGMSVQQQLHHISISTGRRYYQCCPWILRTTNSEVIHVHAHNLCIFVRGKLSEVLLPSHNSHRVAPFCFCSLLPDTSLHCDVPCLLFINKLHIITLYNDNNNKWRWCLRMDSQPKSVCLVWGLAATRRSVCIHQMNSRNDYVMMTAP